MQMSYLELVQDFVFCLYYPKTLSGLHIICLILNYVYVLDRQVLDRGGGPTRPLVLKFNIDVVCM